LNNDFFLILIQNIFSDPYDQIEVLVNHILAIRRIPNLSHAIVIFIPESNLAFEGIHQQHELSSARLPNVHTMIEDDNRAGVKTNRDLKKAMVFALDAVLRKDGGRVFFYKNFVTVGEKYTPDTMREEIVQQLLSYMRITKVRQNQPHLLPDETYHGKFGGKSDDISIALQLNLLMKNRFFNKASMYSQWW
jgi:hypothetical protein